MLVVRCITVYNGNNGVTIIKHGLECHGNTNMSLLPTVKLDGGSLTVWALIKLKAIWSENCCNGCIKDEYHGAIRKYQLHTVV